MSPTEVRTGLLGYRNPVPRGYFQVFIFSFFIYFYSYLFIYIQSYQVSKQLASINYS